MSAEAQPGDGGTRPPPQQAALDRARQVRDALPAGGLFAGATWRTALAAFPLTAAQVRELEALGPQLLAFYRASNILYRHSVTGKLPGWIAEYLDRGKPPALVELSRQGRLKGELPRVIRPDVILTNDHFFITELDSVPGGIGLTGWLGKTYAELGEPVVGGATGMMAGFDAALQAEAKGSNPVIAVVVSEEAATYRPEMEWLGQQMGFGVLRPEEMRAWLGEIAVRSEMRDASGESRLGGSLALPTAGSESRREGEAPAEPRSLTPRPTVVYRFFELFDLPNIPPAAALMQAVAAGQLRVTPPFKPQLEEKMLFAFLWLRPLQEFWREQLGPATLAALQRVFPYTWIVDPTPLPPYGTVPELGIQDWQELKKFSQKQRELVLKISGFSEHAWGSRGVYVGHDLSAGDWAAAVDRALASFPTHPFILQRFEKSKLTETAYADFDAGEIRSFPGRARLCPYYFVAGDTAKLGGILATICPANKKIIHGMPDAVLAPCRVEEA